jgi:hypothetical protein
MMTRRLLSRLNFQLRKPRFINVISYLAAADYQD